MAFVISVKKWLPWTEETMYEVEFIIPFLNQADVQNTMWLVQ